MTLNQLSKQAFATALEELLVTTPVDKIRVTTLAKKVGTSPQTFYYHFKDKYDLIAWIYLNDFFKVQRQRGTEYSADELIKMLMTMEQRKSFYQQVFTDKSQNSIENYATKMIFDYSNKAVKFKYGREMTSQEYIQFVYHNNGVMGLFRDWLFDRLPIDVNQLAQFEYEQTPNFLKEALAYTYKSVMDGS